MLLLLFIYGCEKYKVDEVIQLSGNNRVELEKVLSYYSKEVPDKEKLKAAKFLISNMKWHKSIVTTDSIRIANSFLDSLIYQADSILYKTVFEDSVYAINTPKPLIDAQIEFKRKNYEYSKKYSPKTSNKERYDYEYLSAKQLIEHIDFAFSLKHSSPYLKDISFEDFCEYILPYRTVPDMPVVDFPKSYAELFSKYLKNIDTDSIQQMVNQYNSTIIKLKNFFLLSSYNDEIIGYRKLLYRKNVDCLELANYATLILRAYGLPVATEYNIAYKQLQGKHHRCAILIQNKNWLRWSPDVMRTFSEEYNYIQNSGSMNLYRYTYSAQKDTVGIITHFPKFHYQDIKLNMDKGPYQYYRVQTKEGQPLHLAEAQLLTEQRYGYKEVLPATPLPILSPNNILFIQNKIRLKECNANQWTRAQDGNPLTVEYNPTILFSLKHPCFATYFRFLPINSDNNISPENIYQLRCWSHEKWTVWKNDTAKYNFLEYNLFPGELYWLKCLSGGKEESPFTIDKEGNVKFIYETKIPKK